MNNIKTIFNSKSSNKNAKKNTHDQNKYMITNCNRRKFEKFIINGILYNISRSPNLIELINNTIIKNVGNFVIVFSISNIHKYKAGHKIHHPTEFISGFYIYLYNNDIKTGHFGLQFTQLPLIAVFDKHEVFPDKGNSDIYQIDIDTFADNTKRSMPPIFDFNEPLLKEGLTEMDLRKVMFEYICKISAKDKYLKYIDKRMNIGIVFRKGTFYNIRCKPEIIFSRKPNTELHKHYEWLDNRDSKGNLYMLIEDTDSFMFGHYKNKKITIGSTCRLNEKFKLYCNMINHYK